MPVLSRDLNFDWAILSYYALKLHSLGAYGAAVLYRKKDDDSLVILKEISLHELTATERQMAMNEVTFRPLKFKITTFYSIQDAV